MHEDIKTKDARWDKHKRIITQPDVNFLFHFVLFALGCFCFVIFFSFSSVLSTSVFSSTLTFVLMCSFCLFTAPFYFLKFRCTSVLPLLSFGSSRIRLYSCTVMWVRVWVRMCVRCVIPFSYSIPFSCLNMALKQIATDEICVWVRCEWVCMCECVCFGL